MREHGGKESGGTSSSAEPPRAGEASPVGDALVQRKLQRRALQRRAEREGRIQLKADDAAGGPPSDASKAAPGDEAKSDDAAHIARDLRSEYRKLKGAVEGEILAHNDLVKLIDKQGAVAATSEVLAAGKETIVGLWNKLSGKKGPQYESKSTDLPSPSIWGPVDVQVRALEAAIGRYEKSHAKGDLEAVIAAAKEARAQFEKAHRLVAQYRERVAGGAGDMATILEGVVGACALIETICSGGLAAGGSTVAVAGASAAGAGTSKIVFDGAKLASDGKVNKESIKKLLIEGGKDAATTFVGILVAGPLSKAFLRLFARGAVAGLAGAELKAAAAELGTAADLNAIAEALAGPKVHYVVDLLSGVASAPFSTVVGVVIDRINKDHKDLTTAEFIEQVISEAKSAGVMQVFIGALIHGHAALAGKEHVAPGGDKTGSGDAGKTAPPKHEPAPAHEERAAPKANDKAPDKAAPDHDKAPDKAANDKDPDKKTGDAEEKTATKGDKKKTPLPPGYKFTDPLVDARKALLEMIQNGDGWVRMKELFKEDELRMKALHGTRDKLVDELLRKVIKEQGDTIGWQPTGSDNPTSDYDIQLVAKLINDPTIPAGGKDAPNAFRVQQTIDRFNRLFRTTYGMESGTAIDSNVYYSGEDLVLKREKVGSQQRAPKEYSERVAHQTEVFQDEGGLLKICRYSTKADWADYKNSLLTKAKEKGPAEHAELQKRLTEVESMNDQLQAQQAKAETGVLEEDKQAGRGAKNGNEKLYKKDVELAASNRAYSAQIVKVEALTKQRLLLISKAEEQAKKLASLTTGDAKVPEAEAVESVIADINKRIDDVTRELDLETVKARFLAAEAYHTRDAIKDVVHNQQTADKSVKDRAKAQEKGIPEEQLPELVPRIELTKKQYLNSHNEQCGDLLKDLKDVEKDGADEAIVHSSKYIQRFVSDALQICGDALEGEGKELAKKLKKLDEVNAKLKAFRDDPSLVKQEGGRGKLAAALQAMADTVGGPGIGPYRKFHMDINLQINGMMPRTGADAPGAIKK